MDVEHLSHPPIVVGAAIAPGAASVSAAEAHLSDPLDLFTRAVEDAVADTGTPALGSHVDVMAVVGGLWRYEDPARLVADRLGLGVDHTVRTQFGGQVPIELSAEVARRIGRGEIDVAVIVGGECTASYRARRRLDQEPPPWPDEPHAGPDEVWGKPLDMGDAATVAIGADQPRRCYAALASAIRARRGLTPAAAAARDAVIAAGFARVAREVPHAADRRGLGAEAIATPGPDNRMVVWPYTKAMCANNVIDRAGAFVVCSERAADRFGIDAGRRVFARNHVVGTDTSHLADRTHVGRAPGLEAAADALLGLNGPIDDDTLLDLYCCFPSMVDLTTEALAVSIDRPLTVSGSLGFTGAPLNFAAGEGLIAMVHRLRAEPGAVGIVQGNGGVASSHAFATLSTEAGSSPPAVVGVGSAAGRAPTPSRVVASRDGGTIEGITVDFDRDGPTRALALVGTVDGGRWWVESSDPAVMATAMDAELVGAPVTVNGTSFTLAMPR